MTIISDTKTYIKNLFERSTVAEVILFTLTVLNFKIQTIDENIFKIGRVRKNEVPR